MPLVPRERAAHSGDSEQGFILPLTLWVIAAIGLAVVAVNEWVSQAIDNANVLKRRADSELALANIQNELVFAIGTRPMTYRGMEVGRPTEEIDRTDAMALMTADFQSDRYIRLDGTPYRMESDEDFTVQLFDGRGLINMNSVSANYLRRLLAYFDLPEPVQNSMINSLEDYTDRDDLTRISGAEERDYLRLGRRAPANTWLSTPMEAQFVMGWDQVPALWQRDLDEPLLTTCRVTGFNPNTASREALISSFPNLLEESIQAILEQRAERPFRNIREFAAAANVAIRDEPFFYTFGPGACIIVEVTHRDSGERSRFSLTIDNFSAKTKPWRIDYALPISSKPPTADREPDTEKVFPAPDTMDADQQPDPEGLGQGAPRPVGRQSLQNTSSDF